MLFLGSHARRGSPAVPTGSGEEHCAVCAPAAHVSWPKSNSAAASSCSVAGMGEDVHRMEKSSAGSMSMKDVELLNEQPRQASASTHAREKLSLRDGEASIVQ
jgi:hypothetical protein